jgi:hypothetical protein
MATEVFRTLVSSAPALRAAGTVLTVDAVVPNDAPEGSYLRFAVDLQPADRVNPAITFVYAFERRQGGSWLHMAGGTWTGVEAYDEETGAPYSPQCDVALVTGVSDGQGGRTKRNKRGWRVRGRLELPAPLVAGWRIEVVLYT